MKLIRLILILFIFCNAGNKFSQVTGICGDPVSGSLNCGTPELLCSFPYRYDYDANSLGCSAGNSNSIWHSVNITSNSFDMFIEDAGGTFQVANVYGPFVALNSTICSDISLGFIQPVQFTSTVSNDVNISLSSGAGIYLIEIQENDCAGCLTFELNSGTYSCETSCPSNTNCESVSDIQCGETINLNPSCVECGTSNTIEVWYSLTVNPGDILTVEETAVDASGNPFNFDYALASLPNGMSVCNPDLINTLVINESNVSSMSYSFTVAGTYILKLFNLSDCPNIVINRLCLGEPCETCIGSFSPIPDSTYLIGAWVKEENAANSKTNYDFPEIYVDFTLDNNSIITVGPYQPKGAIIDGWQRIEEELVIPADAVDLKIRLTTNNGPVLYDDIRFFPFNASMKTFVYDPVNMRLAAELDERHYATFYEYDEEGKLVRIKKETEKGIMTIQETKSNSSKKDQ